MYETLLLGTYKHFQVMLKLAVSSASWIIKVKVMSICIAPGLYMKHLSVLARIVKGYQSLTCTPCVLSASGMSHTCLCLPSRSWYSFTDPGGMEG